MASDNGVVIAASYWGKFKTTFQMISVILLIVRIPALTVLTQICVWTALVLTVIVLMQHGKQQGLSGAIAGGAETFFGKNKGRTVDAMLKKVTAVFAVLFIISSIVLTVVSINKYSSENAAVDTGDSSTMNVTMDEAGNLVDENGMHLTYALLNTLIKYPISSCEIDKQSGNIKTKKMGYYLAEKELFEDITSSTGAADCRYPLTYLLEAADDIAYLTADIEDAVKKGFLSYDQLLEELRSEKYISKCADEDERKNYTNMIDWLETKYQNAKAKKIANPELNAVQNWVISIQGNLLYCASYGFTRNYRSIMEGTFTKDVLSVSRGNAMSKALGGIAYEYVFRSKPILKMEISAGNIINFLLDNFIPAAVNFDTGTKLSPMKDRLMNMISDNYRQIYTIYSEGKSDKEKLYLRLLLVTDFVCGMTDSYAKRLYQELSGIE